MMKSDGAQELAKDIKEGVEDHVSSEDIDKAEEKINELAEDPTKLLEQMGDMGGAGGLDGLTDLLSQLGGDGDNAEMQQLNDLMNQLGGGDMENLGEGDFAALMGGAPR